MQQDLLSPAEAAHFLGVSVATLQRMAASGRLAASRTPGGHRRYARAAVEALAGRKVRADHADGLAGELVAARGTQGVLAVLLGLRSRAGSWASMLDTVEAAVADIRRAVQDGTLGRVDARLVLERVARACAAWSDAAPRAVDAPRAMLVCLEGEDHALPLSLAEPVLAEAGMETLWLGRRVASASVARAIPRLDVRLVVAHASSSCVHQGAALLPQLRTLHHACRLHGAVLVPWGTAAWPDAAGMPTPGTALALARMAATST